MKIATAEEMRRIDRKAVEEYGIPSLILMENAGRGVAQTAEREFGPLRGKTVTLICGKGNNGGDGLAAARHLMNQGVETRVYLAAEVEALSEDARRNLDIYRKMEGEVHPQGAYNRGNLRLALMHSHLIVDALLGTGLNAAVREGIAEAVALINKASESGRPVFSIDIPSGIHADTGAVMGCAVKAGVTLSLALPKRGHYLFPGAEHRGRLLIQDIGIPQTMDLIAQIPVEEIEPPPLPSRSRDAHKGDFGHVLVVAGSIGKSGAAAMTALAALRAGAGLVTLAAPRSTQSLLAARLTEVMTVPLPETEEGTLSLDAERPLLELAHGKSVVAVGPGLTAEKETAELVRRLTRAVAVPLILDADGINTLSGHLEILSSRSAPLLLTPHPGEMGRLVGEDAREVQNRRIETVQDFCKRFASILILKGAHTLVGDSQGRIWVNTTGNPGMATAGSGDVLTGLIAGLAGQGMDLLSAAQAGVYRHGEAGDLAARDIGERGMIAGDILDRIPTVLRRGMVSP
jgi:NAD(P)H-hydrate epimerase